MMKQKKKERKERKEAGENAMPRKVYTEELNHLALQVSQMGEQLESMIDQVTQALKDLDSSLAKKIVAEDDIIDDMERELKKDASALWPNSSQWRQICAASRPSCA